MLFRETTPADKTAVLEVHTLAFGQDEESLLVDALLTDPSAQPVLSLVAEDRGRIVGHVLFTNIELVGPDTPPTASILAPLAVIPTEQGTGIGRDLIEEGCKRLARRLVRLVFVLGDPNYYTRHSFTAALPHGIHAPYEIQHENAWMVRALDSSVLGKAQGTVRCADALAPERYWRE